MIASLRTRRAVFWYLAPDRIVAAVMSRAEREPMLEACAASYAPALAGACFAPGLLEVNWVLGAQRQVHVAALAASYCRIETAGEETETPRRRSRVLRGWRPVRQAEKPVIKPANTGKNQDSALRAPMLTGQRQWRGHVERSTLASAVQSG